MEQPNQLALASGDKVVATRDLFLDACCYYIRDWASESGVGFAVKTSEVDAFHSYISQEWKMTNYDKVKQFTEESMGVKCPEKPQVMSKEAAIFITKMVMSEMAELLQTVCVDNEEVLQTMRNCVGADLNVAYKKPILDEEIIAQQNDAMVDAWYYMLNAAAKNGTNLSRIFDVVHGANMAKKWPDGTFHKREDGKVIKPDTWREPDVVAEIKNQMK